MLQRRLDGESRAMQRPVVSPLCQAIAQAVVAPGNSGKEKLMYKSILALILVASWFLLTGCTAGLTTISPPLPAKYEKLGRVEGTATGSLLIDGTAYNFIPLMLNDRAERAYRDALGKAPGATALMDVTYKEDWFWFVIGSAKTVTVSGEAIKEVTE